MIKRVRSYGCVLAVLCTAGFGCSGADEGEQLAETQAAIVQRVTSTLIATEDARTQSPSGDQNFGNGLLWTNTAGHISYVKFDLAALPAGAVIESAELRLSFTGNYANGDNTVELGRVDPAAWSESTLTWNNQPTIIWGGPTAVVGDVAGDVVFDIKSEVANNIGSEISLALRSVTPGGKQYFSRESSPEFAPRLVIRARGPLQAPATDLGDAPQSNNPFGQNNTAYAGAGILGNFPTIFNVPAGQAAGPRHANQSLQGFLGNWISHELAAEGGPDQDGQNNILRGPGGGVADDADEDNADDGWMDPNTPFFHCNPRQLKVRINRPAGATLATMYLNVHRDGNRTGTWGDTLPCPGGGSATEHLVQNQVVNMAAIPAGGFADIDFITERVLNTVPGLPHWMRFTLSEAPAPVNAAGVSDGRGPHPLVAPSGYAFGETEDYLQLPPPPGAFGELELEKMADPQLPEPITNGSPVEFAIRLRHVGGADDVPARLSDPLPAGLIPMGLQVAEEKTGDIGTAQLGFSVEPNPTSPFGFPNFKLNWQGVMSPNSQLVLRFHAITFAACGALPTKTVTNTAYAESAVDGPLSAEASVSVDCPVDLEHQPIDPDILDVLDPQLVPQP
jgi:hypothetical protein